jgi:plastocyanin
VKRRRWQVLCVLGAAAGCGGGSVTPASNTTGADGKATATRTLGPGAGAQTATATVSGVTPTTFHHIAQIQGATQIAANGALVRSDSVLSTVPFSVVVRDQNSQVVAGVTVTWSLSGGGGNLSQPTSITDASGIASVNLTLDQVAAPRSVQAAVTGLQGSPVQFAENGVAGNATQAALSGGNFQAGPVSSPLPLPLTVIVKDAYDNPKVGTSVTWKLEGASAPPPTTTNAAGIASLTRTLGANTGAYHDTATVSPLGTTIAFSDTGVSVTNVSVSNNFFNPATTTISAGTFAKFTWAGGVDHNVTWDGGPVPRPTNSNTQASGTYQARLLQPGTYTYHCTIHGGIGTGMAGSITVN